jgi:hypothetical protein
MLPQRVACGQVPQLGDQLVVAAFVQASLDMPFQRLHVQLFQVRYPPISQQLRRDVCQRGAAPQPQCLRRALRGLCPPGDADRRARSAGKRLEQRRVQLIA